MFALFYVMAYELGLKPYVVEYLHMSSNHSINVFIYCKVKIVQYSRYYKVDIKLKNSVDMNT